MQKQPIVRRPKVKQNRVAKKFLPVWKRVIVEARSGTSRTFFENKHYAQLTKRIMREFNRNPNSLFRNWKESLRQFLLRTKQATAKQNLSVEEMKELAHSFFQEYAPNALTESIRGIKGTNNGFVPLTLGVYELARQKTGSEAKDSLLLPLARKLVMSAKDPKAFDEAIQEVLESRSESQASIRLMRDRQGEREYYRMLLAQRVIHWRTVRKMPAAQREAVIEEEKFGREISTINEIHAAIARANGPTISKICERFVQIHPQFSVPTQAWGTTKLAVLGTTIHGTK